jgi:hypothetical protein
MNETQSSSNSLRRLLVITLYVASLVWGVVQVMLPESGGLYYLFALVMAGAAAWWVVSDARDRGKPILHILQLLIFLLWPIAVPIYLVATRGIRGLGLSVAHAVGLILVLCIGFYVTVFSVHGVNAFATQP